MNPLEPFHIHWQDLTPEAQARLQPLWHSNIDLLPLATLEVFYDTGQETAQQQPDNNQ